MLYLSKELGPGSVWRRAGFIISPEDRVKFRQVEKKAKGIPARENYVQRASGESCRACRKGRAPSDIPKEYGACEGVDCSSGEMVGEPSKLESFECLLRIMLLNLGQVEGY